MVVERWLIMARRGFFRNGSGLTTIFPLERMFGQRINTVHFDYINYG